MKRYFITGTDTDCGKTYATCALLDHFKGKAVAIKPVASGCITNEDGLVSEDALQLHNHSGLTLDEINPWRFKMPVSPHIAARHENTSIPLATLTEYCLNFSADPADYLLIEGAGGLMVPLNDKEFWVDFLRKTQIPVILVVGIKTGCINHALLTQIALHMHDIPFAGWVANGIDKQVLAWDENIATLKKYLKAPLLGIIPNKGQYHCITVF